MTKTGKRELLLELRPLYLRAGKAEKGRILDHFVAATRYHRKYAIRLFVHGPPAHSDAARPGRTPYGPAVVRALVQVWKSCDCICSKRLQPFLPTMLEALERSGELVLEAPIKNSLLAMSAATIERKLRCARRRLKPRGLTTTRPGTLLKHQIPVRTFADWQDTRPGFTEVDLVAHCGDSARGEYLNTVAMVDMATGWFECRAVTYRSQRDVFAALETMRASLPLPLLGIDCDNDTAFINAHLLRYCHQEHITFTRSRPYHKNDQAHVEQKNGSVVRRLVGYDRYEGQRATRILNVAYDLLRLWINFFQPSMKLVEKRRVGSKVHKKYDPAQTPYQRLLASQHASHTHDEKLGNLFRTLNPVALRRQLEEHLNALSNLAVR